MTFKSPISGYMNTSNKSGQKSSLNSGKHHLAMCRPKAYLESSRGKSEFSDQHNIIMSSGGSRMNGMRYSSDIKGKRQNGVPISAQKYTDENGSPNSNCISLKKPYGQKNISPFKKSNF